MKITVVGMGRWGSFLADYCKKLGHEVYTYNKEPDKDVNKLISKSNFYIVAIPCQNFSNFLSTLNKKSKKVPVVIAMKGLEATTGFSMYQLCLGAGIDKILVNHLCGPAHPEELRKGKSALLSLSGDLAMLIGNALKSDQIDFQFSYEVNSCMWGSALKNVVGLGAGILDGCDRADLKGTYMVKILKEVDNIIRFYTKNEGFAYELCHLGDYEATLFSKHSHNRQFGESWVKGEKFEQLAEGYYTLASFSPEHTIQPLISTLYKIFYEDKKYIKEFIELIARR